jgi:methionyl-tRNA formyltransferase
VSGRAATEGEAAGQAPPECPSVVRTVFFGSGSFAVPILETLLTIPGIRVEAVVSAPDRPVGRKAILTPTPVSGRARELGLRLLQPARVRSAESVAALAELAPDLAVLADYGQLIPRVLLDLPPCGFLNLHPSALPRHRGAAPIPAAILAGDAESAITLIVVSDEMDAGPIVATAPLEVRPDDTAATLEERAAVAAGGLLACALLAWLAGELPSRRQPSEGITLTRPLHRQDGRLDPACDAVALERQVRAYQPWPGSFLVTPTGRLIVWHATVTASEPGDRPALLVADGDGVSLTTGDGRLRLDEVQPAGKRRMPGAAFRRGYPGLIGAAIAGGVR